MKILKRQFYLYIYIVSFQIMIAQVQCDWLVNCGKCKCKWNSGKRTADCRNITITNVPTDLSSEVQVLDLSNNRISKIAENSFLLADLENLHKLFIRNSSLETINSASLNGLEILIELDISNNLIKNLPKSVFISLVKLRSLIINNNYLETLNDGLFHDLIYLHRIELKENRITVIGTNVFYNLPQLTQIFLNGNKLKYLRKETFENLKRLTSLSLDSNPWNCSCNLKTFRDFVIKQNLYTPPTACHYPINLRGKLWTDNQPEAFACKPRIVYPSKGTSINTSKENVTLICRVHATPNTLIAWDYNKQAYSSKYPTHMHIQHFREENHIDKKYNDYDILISRLTIIGAEKNDEGIYTCIAQNTAGRDQVEMTLLVQKQNVNSFLLHSDIIIVVCLMVLGLLSATIFLAMLVCFIYRRFKVMNHLQNVEQCHQKRNLVNLNGVNSVNDNFHEKSDGNYVGFTEAQSTQKSDIVGTNSENFSRVEALEGFYDGENSKGHMATGTKLELNDTMQSECDIKDTLGEYQPDLLPHMPQSISFNKNQSMYDYSVNQATSCDNELETQHQRYYNRHYVQEHRIKETNDIQYANNFRKNKYFSKYTECKHDGIIGHHQPTRQDDKITSATTSNTSKILTQKIFSGGFNEKKA